MKSKPAKIFKNFQEKIHQPNILRLCQMYVNRKRNLRFREIRLSSSRDARQRFEPCGTQQMYSAYLRHTPLVSLHP
jgi:hypothetical protein